MLPFNGAQISFTANQLAGLFSYAGIPHQGKLFYSWRYCVVTLCKEKEEKLIWSEAGTVGVV